MAAAMVVAALVGVAPLVGVPRRWWWLGDALRCPPALRLGGLRRVVAVAVNYLASATLTSLKAVTVRLSSLALL